MIKTYTHTMLHKKRKNYDGENEKKKRKNVLYLIYEKNKLK